jgi:HlyD family secretion protein
LSEQKTKTLQGASFKKKTFLFFVTAACIVAAGGTMMVLVGFSDDKAVKTKGGVELFTVRRDNLPITVTESGDIEALKSKDIKSEVEGRTTIISIVDEGTVITEKDVNEGRVLAELDSSQIKERLVQQEIQFLSAEAGFAEARESLEIQKKQNESDLKAGQQKLKFALMDFKKYVGEVLAEQVVAKVVEDPNVVIDMTELLEHPELGGEALQKLRDLENDITLKKEELAQADSKLEGIEKLYEKEYVSRGDLDAERLKKQRSEISLKKALTAKELFVKYEFSKEAEKLLSGYQEAMLELDRTEAKARSRLAQAEAKLKSNEATFLVQKERLEKMRKQLAACTIRAPAPGQVVYASSKSGWRRRNNPIEVGAEIGEREDIISIPDMSVLKVEIMVHEVWIDKVQTGQKAEIIVSAFPDKKLTGAVIKKAPLADRQRWFNPDLRAYATEVQLDESFDYLKTGMSTKVKILIDELKDVLIVPIQAVVNQEGKKVCYVANGNQTGRREIETGEFNKDFVEIKSGLSEGEKVLLNPPRLTETPGETGD